MSFDEKLRWQVYWALDRVKGGHVAGFYKQIREAYKKGSSVEETDEKIQKLIAHAVRTTDFYKDFDENTPLSELPVVNKDTIRSQYERFYSSEFKDASDNRVMSTSGSTGTPFRVLQNKQKIEHNTAGSIFLGAAGGYYIGMKQAFIRMWVGDHAKKSKFRLIEENLIMMDCANLDDAAIGEMVEIIRKKKVKVLIGYSSALGDICRYIEEHHVDTSGFSVKSILPISESMPDTVRRKLEEQFSCTCRAWYSNEENGIMGIQNVDDGAYYIDSESYYYEILKMDSDEPAEPGELGRIVITDLYNYALPMIRYDNGDMAIGEKKVKNGRFKMYLKELYGRKSDVIYDTKGRTVSPFVLFNNLALLDGLKQYRFIQEDVKEYTLRLNGNPEEIDEKRILDMVAPYFGEDATIKVEYVDEIPVLSSGKQKYIENRCERYAN